MSCRDVVGMEEDIAELYKLREGVDEAVKESFGRSPNYGWYHKLEIALREKEFVVKSIYPEEYKKYQDKYY